MTPIRNVVLACLLAACGPQLTNSEEDGRIEQTEQALTLATLEGESMSGGSGVVVDLTASGNHALRLGPQATASVMVAPGAPGTSVAFRVYRNGCNIVAPLELKVGAALAGTVNVSSASWQTLTLPASVPAIATLTVKNLNNTTCRIYLDTLVIDGPSLPPPPPPAPVVTTYQAEDAAFTGGGIVVPGAYRQFFVNGTASRTITTTAPATQLVVNATAVRCNLNVPRVVVKLDGVTVIDLAASTGGWQQVSAPLASIPAGTHNLSIGYANDSDQWPWCDSHLDVDWVQLTTQP